MNDATLAGTDFSGATIASATFENAFGLGLTAQQLYSTASYQRRDLHGIDLSMDLTGWNFSGQNLQVAHFWSATLTGVSLAGADLANAVFTHATLTNASLADSNLTNSSFYATALTNASLARANLTGAIFYKCIFGRRLHRRPDRIGGPRRCDGQRLYGATALQHCQLSSS